MQQVINTLLADDHQLFTEGLKNILGRSQKYAFNILGEALNGKELITLIETDVPDLILLDLNMPESDGLEVLEQIRKKYKDLRILALTMYDEVKLVKSAFKSGVDGYILKNSDPKDLLFAIDVILQGKTYLGDGVELVGKEWRKNGLVEAGSKKKFEDSFIQKYNLTKREMEILRLITQALSNKEIADELYISDQTVGVHRKNIMRKLSVSNIAGLIKIAYDNSLV